MSIVPFLFLVITHLHSQSPLFPYTTLFRSLVTGRKIAESAAYTVKNVALELGGKNPNIIFADADFDAALDNALTAGFLRSEEHTSELQSRFDLVCRLLLEKKKQQQTT